LGEDKLQLLIRQSNQFGDNILERQLTYVACLTKLLPHLAAVRVATSAGDKAPVTKELADAVIMVRSSSAALLVSTRQGSCEKVFENPEALTEEGHMLHGLDSCPMWCSSQVLLTCDVSAMELARSWETSLSTLVDHIKGWTPHWEVVKDKLLEHGQVCEAMVLNPHYLELNNGAKLLQEQLPVMKAPCKDGNGPWMSADVITEAASVARMATDTLLHCYAVLQTTAIVPSVKAIAKRKEMAGSVLAELQQKASTKNKKLLSVSVEKRLQLLRQGKAFDVVDYEAIQKAQEAAAAASAALTEAASAALGEAQEAAAAASADAPAPAAAGHAGEDGAAVAEAVTEPAALTEAASAASAAPALLALTDEGQIVEEQAQEEEDALPEILDS